MIRAVLDANVLASAFIRSQGPSATILRRFKDGREFQVVLSSEILEEFQRVLFYPRLRKELKLSDDEILARVAAIGVLAELADEKLDVAVVKPDPADDKYFAAAIHGQAAFIVTGDHHLLDIGEFQGIRILTPRRFLAVLDSIRPTEEKP